jgi:hypothetical protein
VRIVECPREQDVIDALVSERWPGRVAEDLRGHVAGCGICGDVVAVMHPILMDRDNLTPDARIPSSAVMWWRAQMRARQEALREAARPITVAQVVGSMCALGLAAALAVMVSPLMRAWMPELTDGLPIGLTRFDFQSALLTGGWLLPALMVTLLLVLTPLAVYFAVLED